MANGANKRRRKGVFLNGCLVLLLLVQIYVLGSFSLNGYCRLYAPACQWLISHSLPDTFKLSASKFNIYPNGHLEIMQLEMSSHHPAAQSVHIEKVHLAIQSLLKAKVRLYLNQIAINRPHFIGPSKAAQKSLTPFIIDQVQLDLLYEGDYMKFSSIQAFIKEWSICGSVEILHLHHLTQTKGASVNWPQLHSKVDNWIKTYQSLKQEIVLGKPVIHFSIKQKQNGDWDTAVRLDAEKAGFTGTQLREIEGSFNYHSSTQNSVPQSTLSFKIGELSFKRGELQVIAKSVIGYKQITAKELSRGLENLQLSINAPQVTINQVATLRLPSIDLQVTKSGVIKTEVLCYLEQLVEKLPTRFARFNGCSFGTAPKLKFELKYLPKVSTISELIGEINAKDFQLRDLAIDCLQTVFSWQQNCKEIQMHRAYLQRGLEWIELDGRANLERKDYRLAVEASTILTDYNSIMPAWWKKVLRDVQFLDQATCNANFEIEGRFEQKLADFFYGSVHAQNLAYREVPIDNGQLIVHGRQHYSEIKKLFVQQGKHSANGSIHIAALPDPIKAPLFWSIDVNSSLPLQAYQKLVNPNVACQIRAFEAQQAPKIHLKGKFFTRHYPQYRPYMFFQIDADSLGPIHFRNVPLDSLQLKLAGNAARLSIYDLQAVTANGHVGGQIDFNWQSDRTSSMCLKADFEQCDTGSLLKMFHQKEREKLANLTTIEGSPSKIDLKLHLKGPIGNWYAFNGYGRASILDKALGSIKFLGPLSSRLQNTSLNFTSLKFQTLECGFEIAHNLLKFDKITISGQSSQIEMKGQYNFELDELDFRATLLPLSNYLDKINPITQLNRLLHFPLAPFLKFNLGGSLQNPSWRSIMDPRSLLQLF